MTRTDHQIAAPNTAQPRRLGSRARIGLASAALATLAVLVAACNSADHGAPQADTTTSAADIPTLNLGGQRVVACVWVPPGYTIRPAELAQMVASAEFGGDQTQPELLGDGLTHRR
jgi:hypothetical protein